MIRDYEKSIGFPEIRPAIKVLFLGVVRLGRGGVGWRKAMISRLEVVGVLVNRNVISDTRFDDSMCHDTVILSYCSWLKSCTTKDDDYLIVNTVLTMPGGAGFLPSTVVYVSQRCDLHSFLGFCWTFKERLSWPVNLTPANIHPLQK